MVYESLPSTGTRRRRDALTSAMNKRSSLQRSIPTICRKQREQA
jgi:hypothetical protein